MKEQETFKMTYSAQQQEEIEQIRKKYIPQQPDKMEQLRRLDASVSQKATTISVAVGVVGTLLLGLGMSLAMTDLGASLDAAAMPVGIVLGLVGIGILACAYPLHNRTIKKEREKIAPEILRLSDELQNH